MNGNKRMCMSGGKLFKESQVTDKIVEWIFYVIHIQSFTSDSNLRNNNLSGFENSRMDTGWCVWVEKSNLKNDKWQIKLLSDLFFTIHI